MGTHKVIFIKLSSHHRQTWQILWVAPVNEWLVSLRLLLSIYRLLLWWLRVHSHATCFSQLDSNKLDTSRDSKKSLHVFASSLVRLPSGFEPSQGSPLVGKTYGAKSAGCSLPKPQTGQEMPLPCGPAAAPRWHHQLWLPSAETWSHDPWKKINIYYSVPLRFEVDVTRHFHCHLEVLLNRDLRLIECQTIEFTLPKISLEIC